MEAVTDQPNDIQTPPPPPVVKDPVKEVLDEAPTPMDTNDCSITNNKEEEKEAAATNIPATNGTATETPVEATIEFGSDTSSLLSDKTRILSQNSNVSMDVIDVFASQEDAVMLKGEKSGEIALHVSSEVENLVNDGGADSQEDTDVDATFVTIVTSDEERQSEVPTDVVTEDDSDNFLSPPELSSQDPETADETLVKDESDEKSQEIVPEEEQPDEKSNNEPIAIVELDDTDDDDEENGEESEGKNFFWINWEAKINLNSFF